MWLAALAVLASAESFRGCSNKLKESIVSPPSGWIKQGAAPKDHIIKLKIGLPRPKFPVLEQHLWEVSDPSHERYGAHLSKQEVDALMAPSQESVDIVEEWLAFHGLEEESLVRSSSGDWVTILVPVSLAEDMLDTVRQLLLYSHVGIERSFNADL